VVPPSPVTPPVTRRRGGRGSLREAGRDLGASPATEGGSFPATHGEGILKDLAPDVDTKGRELAAHGTGGDECSLRRRQGPRWASP